MVRVYWIARRRSQIEIQPLASYDFSFLVHRSTFQLWTELSVTREEHSLDGWQCTGKSHRMLVKSRFCFFLNDILERKFREAENRTSGRRFFWTKSRKNGTKKKKLVRTRLTTWILEMQTIPQIALEKKSSFKLISGENLKKAKNSYSKVVLPVQRFESFKSYSDRNLKFQLPAK